MKPLKYYIQPFLILLIVLSSYAEEEKRYAVPILDSPVLGPANAPITIVEFLDYQ